MTNCPPVRILLTAFAALAVAAGCSGGEVQCETGPVPAPGAICAPAAAPADTALTLRAREMCGGCAQYATSCEVTRDGNTLTVNMIGDNCTLPSNVDCPAICSVSEFACETPPLPAGTYTVTGLSDTATSTAPIVIEVGAGTDTDCTL